MKNDVILIEPVGRDNEPKFSIHRKNYLVKKIEASCVAKGLLFKRNANNIPVQTISRISEGEYRPPRFFE